MESRLDQLLFSSSTVLCSIQIDTLHLKSFVVEIVRLDSVENHIHILYANEIRDPIGQP
jgi:hypothetical protein